MNGNVRMDFVKLLLSMSNPFIYKDYLIACEDNKIEPYNINTFSQRAGMAFVAINQYPDLDPSLAYGKFVHKRNMETAKRFGVQKRKPCGNCGKSEVDNGGKVL